MNEYDILICRLLYEWLQTKDKQFSDAVYYVDRSHWQHNQDDVFGTFEALEVRVEYRTYVKLRRELLEILNLFGKEISNYTK
nr:unnamed protein product [uncultured bacterium]